MRVRNRTVSVVWKVLLLLIGAWGLLDGSGILAGRYDTAFPYMFTNISNLFTSCAVLHRGEPALRAFAPVVKYTAAISLLVTMAIGHLMLSSALFHGTGVGSAYHMLKPRFAFPRETGPQHPWPTIEAF
jgi:hypothetical protein